MPLRPQSGRFGWDPASLPPLRHHNSFDGEAPADPGGAFLRPAATPRSEAGWSSSGMSPPTSSRLGGATSVLISVPELPSPRSSGSGSNRGRSFSQTTRPSPPGVKPGRAGWCTPSVTLFTALGFGLCSQVFIMYYLLGQSVTPPPASPFVDVWGSSSVGRGLTRPSPDYVPPPPPQHTSQTCYTDSDESETCVYSGPLCTDGTTVYLSVPAPSALSEEGPVVDSIADCMDNRYLDPIPYEDGECSYLRSGARSYNPALHPISPKHDAPLTSPQRWWGPANRHNTFFREIHHECLFGGGGGNGTVATSTVVKGSPFTHEKIRGLTLESRTEVTGCGVGVRPSSSSSGQPSTHIDWVDSHLWLGAVPGQGSRNPFHWFSAVVGPLWAAVRNNGTCAPPAPDGSYVCAGWGANPRDAVIPRHDGSLLYDEQPLGVPSGQAPPGHPSTSSWRSGPQWPLPPLSLFVGVSDGAKEVEGGEGSLGEWFRRTLRVALPKGATALFGEVAAAYAPPSGGAASPRRLLCSKRGGVLPSLKPALFTGGADAWLYRGRTFSDAQVQLQGHPRFPPRTITVLDRVGTTRSIVNLAALLTPLRASGLPVTIIPNMGALSFNEQVALMAGTGILVASHGAALVNSLFLPQHAAVIELFPPLMKKLTYRNLAVKSGLHYFPVHSRVIPADGTPIEGATPFNSSDYLGMTVMKDPRFVEECLQSNATSYESLVLGYCNWASKTLPIIVPRKGMRDAVLDAVDAIGAFSRTNPEWAALSKGEGVPALMPSLAGWEVEPL